MVAPSSLTLETGSERAVAAKGVGGVDGSGGGEGGGAAAASGDATALVAEKSVGIDAGVLHPSGGDIGGVGVRGIGVMHPTWLSNWGSWIVRVHGARSSLTNAGGQLWGVDVVSRVGDGGGGVLHPVVLSRSGGTWLASNSAASTCDAAC